MGTVTTRKKWTFKSSEGPESIAQPAQRAPFFRQRQKMR
jgi:hypothetical protein